MRALSLLFPTDPKISPETGGWLLQASALDKALMSTPSASPSDAVPAVCDKINGAAALIFPWWGDPIRWTLRIEIPGRVSAYGTFSYDVTAPAVDEASIDPAYAALVFERGTQDVQLERVLGLMGDPRPEWVWFDLWRAWDALWMNFGTGKSNNEARKKMRAWVGDDQAFWDFERTANDPELSWPLTRHLRSSPHSDAIDEAGNPRGNKMEPQQAREFILSLLKRWVETEADTHPEPTSN